MKKVKWNKVLCFALGVLLSTVISIVSVTAVLPSKLNGATNAGSEITEVTTELVKNTVTSSIGEYLSANKIPIAEEDVNTITQTIMVGVDEQAAVTNETLQELEGTIKTAVTSVATLEQNTTSADVSISDSLRNYIDKEIVPAVVASIKMNSDDIVKVNQEIVALGEDYDTYKDTTDSSIEDIQKSLQSYADGTETEFGSVAIKMDTFCESYNEYVTATDEGIMQITSSLDEKIQIADFEAFQDNYSTYKNEVEDVINNIQSMLSTINEKKADQSTVETLTSDFNSLSGSYTEFIGADGAFSTLRNRVVSTETRIAGTENKITAAESRIAETEDALAQLETRVSEMEDSLSGLYPVGAVYMTFGTENPTDIYGGTWERVEDTFLMASGTSHPIGTSGGSNNVNLTAANIPSLSITGQTTAKNGVATSAAGNHAHSLSTYAANGVGSTTVAGAHGHSLNLMSISVDNIGTSGSPYYGMAVFSGASGITTNSAGEHQHSLNIPALTGGTSTTGNHQHTLNIPSLSLNGAYTNNALAALNITNKYVTVNVWRRIA